MDDLFRVPDDEAAAQGPAPMRGDMLVLRVPCINEYHRVCRLLISGLAQKLGLSWDAVEDLKLATSEGCSLVTGEEPDATGVLEMHVHIHDDRLEITLHGPGTVALPSGDADPVVDSRAMGLFFIQSLMDEVQYEATQLHMVKTLDT
jgi:serine/threonine-protein kinase RsbW